MSTAPRKMTTTKFTLPSGDLMPAIGLGTRNLLHSETLTAVQRALERGYRHIDTAFSYENEKAVGMAIVASGVPRENIWLTTKIANECHGHVEQTLEKQLEILDTPYIDLLLMESPCCTEPEDSSQPMKDWDFIKTWNEMQKLLAKGVMTKVRNIGVSNFGVENLDRLLSDATCIIKPAVNQIELHPCNPSSLLVEFSASRGVHTTGYCPLGSDNSPLFEHQTVLDIAAAKNKSPQQVLIMWGLQKGWSVVPRSANKDHIDANFDMDGWALSEDQMRRLSSIEERFKVCDDSKLPIKIFAEHYDE